VTCVHAGGFAAPVALLLPRSTAHLIKVQLLVLVVEMRPVARVGERQRVVVDVFLLLSKRRLSRRVCCGGGDVCGGWRFHLVATRALEGGGKNTVAR
jgi:hypothetical protein